MSTLTDEELVTRCQSELPGDTRSFELLVQRHMNRVFSLVYRVVGNKEEAEDITQEVFLKVYHHLHTFEQQASFSSWLYRVATNTALDALERMKRRPQATPPMRGNKDSEPEGKENTNPLHHSSSPVPGPEESVILAELRECIKQILEKLERNQANLIVMRDFQNLSYDEIANSFALSLSAIKMRIHRARLAFQELFMQLCGAEHLRFSVPSSYSFKDKSKKG